MIITTTSHWVPIIYWGLCVSETLLATLWIPCSVISPSKLCKAELFSWFYEWSRWGIWGYEDSLCNLPKVIQLCFLIFFIIINFLLFFYIFSFCLFLNPYVEDWLSVDHSKPWPRSRLSTNGLAPGSPGTCHVWRARGLPPFWLCHMSQEEGLSTPDPGPGTWWAAPRGTVCWQGLQGTSYPRPTEGKHYPVTRGKQGHYKKRKL